MIEIVKSDRDRTCHECGRIIPAGVIHFELRGGPKFSYDGCKLNWVHYTHIACADKCVARAKRRENRRRQRERSSGWHV